ncbi:MAG: tRNA epoxyqueuosine(34) reductase QueG [Acidobacteria bacterium]|nr:MAG: tRNA epoxyqueuosine(34) reductase QueG [Acidobacteriota bacterium]
MNRGVHVSLIETELRTVAREIGLSAIGFGAADPFEETRSAITTRAGLGYFGAMKFVMADPARSCFPDSTLAGAKSIVTAALGYWRPAAQKPGSGYARVARYAWQDHYRLLRAKLETLADVLRRQSYRAVVLSDSNALVDRAPAVRAGLGFFGKNSNVITPSAGSWVVFGSILTTASLATTQGESSSCGACTSCIDSCPTRAIVSPGVIDSRRCIAYLLQAPGLIPMSFRRQIGDRIYGCDECQDSCPINRRSLRATPPAPTGLPASNDESWVSVPEILCTRPSMLAERFRRFYMPRNDYEYLHRNALIALGNSGDPSYVELATEFLGHPRPMLRATAAWALGEVGTDRSAESLRGRHATERDDLARNEISLALKACAS